MKLYLFISILNLFIFNNTPDFTKSNNENLPYNSKIIFSNLGSTNMSFKAFDLAFKGWLELKDSITINNKIIAIIDFNKPSTDKRFYLVNLETEKIIYQNYVAHGRNSGNLKAQKFSNIPSSFQSSLGFYKTAETYFGKHGLSLKLDGLEKGINHLARKRNIVIHSADYAEETFIKKYGRLGRSLGCPALPKENYKKLISQIKEGTLLFIYFPKSEYLNNSLVLN